MIPSLGVVVAVSRPERIESIVRQFKAQTYQGAELVLCLNGAAHNAGVPFGSALRCEGGTPARPRNAGLNYLRCLRADIVAFWDDDDGYLPGYLAETVDALRDHPRRVTGKFVRHVRFDDGEYYLLGKQDSFLGGTMAGWVQSLPPIPDLPRDEDRIWCQELARTGYELYPLGGRHYIYNRTSGQHAWQSTKLQTLAAFGPAFAIADSTRPKLLSGAPFIPRPSLHEVTQELLANVLARPIDHALLTAAPERELT